MVLYLVLVWPFKSRIDNITNIFNEAVLLLVFASLMGVQYIEMSDNAMSKLGWFLIVLVGFSLLLTWILLVPNLIKGCWDTVKSIWNRLSGRVGNSAGDGDGDGDKDQPEKPNKPDDPDNPAKQTLDVPKEKYKAPSKKDSSQGRLHKPSEAQELEMYVQSKSSRTTNQTRGEYGIQKSLTSRHHNMSLKPTYSGGGHN